MPHGKTLAPMLYPLYAWLVEKRLFLMQKGIWIFCEVAVPVRACSVRACPPYLAAAVVAPSPHSVLDCASRPSLGPIAIVISHTLLWTRHEQEPFSLLLPHRSAQEVSIRDDLGGPLLVVYEHVMPVDLLLYALLQVVLSSRRAPRCVPQEREHLLRARLYRRDRAPTRMTVDCPSS